MSPTPPDLHALARSTHACGLCVLPPREDGSKQPLPATWAEYQTRRSTLDEIAAWYRDGRRTGIGPLVARIASGYSERTPGDGVHWLLFVAGGAKTVALARRMGVDRAGKPMPVPLIETKGEGGYVMVAPSWGRVRPSGNP